MTLADRMIVDEDVHRFERTLETVFDDDGEFPVRSVLELSLPTGRKVAEYRFSPMRRDGDVIGAVVVARDITERVKREELLGHRKKQLSLLHDATRDLLSADSPEQVADIASDAAEDILNLRHNGIHFYDAATDGLVPVAVSDASRELLGEVPVVDGGIGWEAFQSGEPRIYEDLSEAEKVLNLETPMRSEIILPLDNHGVLIVSSPEAGAFDDSDIELTRTLAANIKTAIQRIEKEQKLQTRETELERKNEQLDEFATVVSHDLRNPLNVAQGQLKLVQPAHESEQLDAIDRSLDRMETMIDDILTLARQGESVSEFEAVDIDDLTEQCWQTVPTEDATVHVETDARIKGDKTRLQRLFENLFRNAIQHGGDDVRVQIGELDENGFYVADNGPGVPEDKCEEVFTDGVSTTNSGSELGLVIVKEIAEAHGWTISVTVSQDGGAQFEFTGVEFE